MEARGHCSKARLAALATRFDSIKNQDPKRETQVAKQNHMNNHESKPRREQATGLAGEEVFVVHRSATPRVPQNDLLVRRRPEGGKAGRKGREERKGERKEGRKDRRNIIDE